ncbi:MAG: hypothetical protein BGN98_11675 [Microbacterium sp. 69-7]|uniref:hypothetical protein n=1 Tax=unclassified Microbacterium TaxID=2609290 RepID=UPI00034EAF6A|nr:MULTISPECIES: hypothetical protein [unclassified Microbacterium]EPD85244.1 hypothetical protein HMPREF1529_01860 [Microbacterium sp. oral taxon 186 str. F0373]EXJ51288.1 hypothetical protein AS96_10330 [Microbacterium sp. MRS-1]ODT23363.1 MAG: hypothetical protein ABS64_10400 [Microbacterium sp. SCN 69-37]OJU43077.1 MAG: hypothetical protein BGN98_11675 [Microbacterium sp. 69-7]
MSPDAAPELVFRLIGTWWPVALDSDENARASATDIARGTLGTADQNATPRRRMRDDLVDAARAARDAQGRLLLLQTELSPNEPMSAMLTLFDDDRFHMSPSIGTNPQRVLSVLEEALPTIAPEMAGTAVRRPFTDGEVVRTHRVDESVEVEDGATFTRRRLVAHYWYPVPDSKKLSLVVLSTPLGDIPNALLAYFDAIVEVSGFRSAPETAVDAAGAAAR